MDFGRLDDVDGVDLRLPAPDPRSIRALAGSAGSGPRGPVRVWLGTPSWNAGLDALWPPRTPPREHLAHYATRFPSVELNATFHALPERPRVDAWAREVPPGFRFCAKVPRAVSHEGAGWADAAARYRDAWEGFGDRAGPGFFQAPPEAAPWHLAELLARVDALGPAVRALEVRHPGWFARGTLLPELHDALAARGLATCISDTPGRRDAVHGSLPGPVLVVRFLAVLGHPSTAARLAAWADRIRGWGRHGLTDVHFFVHQPDNLGLLDIAAEAERAFGDLVVAAPRPAGRQVGLFGG